MTQVESAWIHTVSIVTIGLPGSLFPFPGVAVRILCREFISDRNNFGRLPLPAQALLHGNDLFPRFPEPVAEAISTQIEISADPIQVLAENQFEFAIAALVSTN
jgi:hypothetical protein